MTAAERVHVERKLGLALAFVEDAKEVADKAIATTQAIFDDACEGKDDIEKWNEALRIAGSQRLLLNMIRSELRMLRDLVFSESNAAERPAQASDEQLVDEALVQLTKAKEKLATKRVKSQPLIEAEAAE